MPLPPHAGVAVECPALAAESRAALEARARAQLLVQQLSGDLVVTCSGRDANLEWRPVEGTPRSARLVLPEDGTGAVDRALEALEPLLAEPAPESPPAAPMPAEPLPAEPPAEPPIVRPVPPLAPAPPPAPPPPEEPADRAPPVALALTAGAFFELWSLDVVGVAGPELGALLRLPGGVVLDAGVAAGFGLAAPLGVRGRVLRGELGAEYRFGEGRRLAAGAFASVDALAAEADAGSSADQLLLGFGASASFAVVSAPIRVPVGATLRVHPGQAVVERGGREAFRVPLLTPGVFAGVELDVL